jgi:hypothetical protein
VSGETRFFSERFTEALTYAVEMHNEQARKGSDGKVAYVGHLLGVCSLVIEEGGSETQAIASLLHDAAEDHGGQKTLDEIRNRFGAAVAEIVLACTDTLEEEKPDWRVRKTTYLDHLKDRDELTLMVSLADKLFNARAILRDYEDVGEEVWRRFKAGREGQLWYYGRLSAEFTRLLPQSPMTHELASIVAELAAATTMSSDESSFIGELLQRHPWFRGRWPGEPLLTEATAAVFRRVRSLADAFAGEMLSLPDAIEPPKDVTVRTEYYVHGFGRPDVVLEGGVRHLVWIELKDRAREGPNQLPRYLAALKGVSGRLSGGVA